MRRLNFPSLPSHAVTPFMRIEPCLFHSATLVSCATRCYPWSFFFCHHGDPLWAWGHVCSFIFAFSFKSFIQWVDKDYANFSPKMFFLVVTQIRASPGSHQEQKCICKSQIHDFNYMRWVSVRYMLVICYKENNTTKRERGNTKGEKMRGLQSEPAPTSPLCRMDVFGQDSLFGWIPIPIANHSN